MLNLVLIGRHYLASGHFLFLLPRAGPQVGIGSQPLVMAKRLLGHMLYYNQANSLRCVPWVLQTLPCPLRLCTILSPERGV